MAGLPDADLKHVRDFDPAPAEVEMSCLAAIVVEDLGVQRIYHEAAVLLILN